MVKNKLEKMFSKSIHNDRTLYGMKLHNNPLAHQNTPADYFINLEKTPDGMSELWSVLVECKQVTCREGKGRLAFKRLKQMHDLLMFKSFSHFHEAYWCIAFWDGSWADSEIYLIPTTEMKQFIDNCKFVSVNRHDMHNEFNHRLCQIETGSIINIRRYI